MTYVIGKPCIDVQVRDGLAHRIKRVSRIIFGTEEAFLLCGDSEEEHRAVGPGTMRPDPRLLDQLRAAGAVVDCAIVDAIAGRVRFPDAEMVPVRRLDDRLVRMLRPGEDADYIMAVDDLRRRRIARRKRGLERDRLEIGPARSDFRLVEVEPRALEQLDGDWPLDPAFELRVPGGRVFADDVELRDGVRVLDDFPAVGGGSGLVANNVNVGGSAAPWVA